MLWTGPLENPAGNQKNPAAAEGCVVDSLAGYLFVVAIGATPAKGEVISSNWLWFAGHWMTLFVVEGS